MAADIILDRIQYPASIRVRETCLGNPALWIHDGCFDVAVQLTPATACALAEQLLAYQSSDAGGTGDDGRMQVAPELEAPLGRGQADRAADVAEPLRSGDELRGRGTTTPRSRSHDVTTVRQCKLRKD